jgi:hypothetical protein
VVRTVANPGVMLLAQRGQVSPAVVVICVHLQGVRPTLELSCEAPFWLGFVSFNSLLGGLVVPPHRSVRSGNAPPCIVVPTILTPRSIPGYKEVSTRAN